MTKKSTPNSSFRFFLIGGWTAVKSATIGSVLAVLATFTFWGVYQVWQIGLQAIEFNSSDFQSLGSSVAFLLLVAILLSVLPAFTGGVFLAWLMNREYSKAPAPKPRRIILGTWVGASAGIVLSLLVLIPMDFVGRLAHGGLGYNLLYALPTYMYYAIEIIAIATLAGVWTDYQLRKYLESAGPSNTG